MSFLRYETIRGVAAVFDQYQLLRPQRALEYGKVLDRRLHATRLH